ncbi:MAG: hypothetical protein GY953_03375, partial [bacterium]|nr:hypothetical protein [bacterium]
MSKRFFVISRLAIRNLRRQVRRTVLTSLAMIIGGMLLMISLPLGDGTHEAWIESGVRMGGGHITIQNPDFRASRKIEDRLPAESRTAAEEALLRAGLKEHIVTATPQLTVGGLASSPGGARPA